MNDDEPLPTFADYEKWSGPVVAFRHALHTNPERVDSERTAWESWLAERGVPTTWLPRISVSDPRHGEVTVVDGPYDDPVVVPRIYSPDSPHPEVPATVPVDGGRYWTVRDASIVGAWDVVRTSKGACWPALDPSTEGVLVSNALESRLLGWTSSHLIVRESAGPRRFSWRRRRAAAPRLEAGIALVGEHSFQYGHWLIDYLSRALSVRKIDVSIPVLVDASVPANARWWLAQVLPGRDVVDVPRGQAIEVRTLVVPLQRTFCPTGWIDSLEMKPTVWPWDSRAIAAMHQAVTAGRSTRPRHRRVWLARRSGYNRPLVNHRQLADRVARDGFEVVHPEDVPMPELQTLLDETRHVIAPVGAQVRNIVASRPGLQVLVLVGDELDHGTISVNRYASVCGHTAALVAGRSVGPVGNTPYERKQAAYEVDPTLLDDACRDFFGEASCGGGR